MRSHAKASTAGSTQRRQGASLGSLGAVLLFTLLAVACLSPGAALAIETRPQIESFGPNGTGASSFSFPNALAFDQGNNRLYALDQAGELHGFDASIPGIHTPLGGSFPLSVQEGGEVPHITADSASHNIFYAVSEGSPGLYGYSSAGAPLGGKFPIGGFGFPCGTAVDPSGHIWVAEYNGLAIKEFDAAGNSVDSFSTAGKGNPCHLAFDSEANLYASIYEGSIWRFTAASDYESATEVDSTAGAPVAAIAVDRSTDNLYVARSGQVTAYDSSGAVLYQFGSGVSGANFKGVAIDQASDRVYLSDNSNAKVHVFGPPVPLPEVTTEDASDVITSTATLHGKVDPEDAQLTDCHFEYVTEVAFKVTGFSDLGSGGSAPCVPAAASIPADSNPHTVEADISGLSAGTTYHVRLVASTAEGTANSPSHTLTTAIGPPVIGDQFVEAVGTSDAIFSAKINPKGAKTTYHVEYGTTEAYGQSSAESLPIGFPGDNSNHNVSVHVGGLTPGTEYHFRFVATSPAGSDEGPDTKFLTYVPPPAFGSCPNDQFRTGVGARLPDCRAYEQATPVDKHGADIQGSVNSIQASSAGDRVTFYLVGGLPTTGGSSEFTAHLASRGSTGWSSDGLLPATDPGFSADVFGWSDDLSTTVVTAPGPGNVGETLYLRDSDTGAFQLGLTSSFVAGFPAGFAADTSHLIFESQASLLPSVPPGFHTRLYELDNGILTLAGRIPAGAATSCDDAGGPACVPAPEGSFAGPYNWLQSVLNEGGVSGVYYTQNTISRDGSRVFFTARNSGRLYVREDGARTTQVSASQRTVPDPNGAKPAAFMAATPDGSKVFFTSCEKLTDDSTAVSTAANTCATSSQGQDLYSYDVDTGELIDLTVDSNGNPKGAAVQGLLGTSEDGSHVYFAADGVLAPGASLGEKNLYVSHEGTTTFIVSLSGLPGDSNNWLPAAELGGDPGRRQKTSRVSADGSTLLFSSIQELTGYDNAEPTASACKNPENGGDLCDVLFLYSADDEELICLSCNPTGMPPQGDALLGTARNFLRSPPRSKFLTRNLSVDGNRVFFDSSDALLPTDTNGLKDVYEWEAEGSGSCETEEGCIYLISSGTSPDPSYLADASVDGDHAFFFTTQQLVPFDRDQLFDVYRAGVNAGLPSQHLLAPPTCTTTACQVNPPPPPEQTPASASFSGPGNPPQPNANRRCPKGKRKVRRAGKVRCQKRKQSKRHNNRGGAK